MRGHWVCLLAAGLFLSSLSPAACEEIPEAGSLAARLNWVQYEIVRGRVTALNSRLAASKSQTCGGDSQGPRESYSLTVGDSAPSVSYELQDADQHLTVELNCGNCLRVHRRPARERQAAVRFVQPPRGPVALEIAGSESAASRRLVADDLWQLLLLYPAECREHLIPVLEVLRPDWRLAEQGRAIERRLLELAQSSQLPDRSGWAGWVAELSSSDARLRRAADHRLRAVGQAILPYLESLDPAGLDAEQRLRVRQICDELTMRSGDDAQRVAVWLSVKPGVWVGLLAHHEEAMRHLAARQLSTLSGRAIPFDAGAEPEQRQRQIQQLSAWLAAD
ncbi:MAG: hypothetical protein J5I93_19585 [Pirellulaceae bacterium]|nr:hypothetical protein [Pirellulaceae bacterium]